MAPFDGPDRIAPDLLVGEIRALRTFRLGPDGSLLPVAHGSTPWSDGANSACCGRGSHTPAAPGCSCGFYAYGTRRATSRSHHAHSRRVLAVIACWGRVVPGTLGLRAQHARIEALWVSRRVPAGQAAMVRRRYPSAAFYASRRSMLQRHRLTHLDCYRRPPLVQVSHYEWNWLREGAGTLGGCLLYILLLLGAWPPVGLRDVPHRAPVPVAVARGLGAQSAAWHQRTRPCSHRGHCPLLPGLAS